MRKDKTVNLGYGLSAPANEPIQVDLIVALGSVERDQMAAVPYNAGYAKKILLTGMGVGSIAGQGLLSIPLLYWLHITGKVPWWSVIRRTYGVWIIACNLFLRKPDVLSVNTKPCAELACRSLVAR